MLILGSQQQKTAEKARVVTLCPDMSVYISHVCDVCVWGGHTMGCCDLRKTHYGEVSWFNKRLGVTDNCAYYMR